jgi:tetratricopeptide (TPR) repeat protein
VTRANQLERDNRLTEAIGEWNNVQQYNPNDADAKAAVARIRGRIESMSQDYSATQRKLRIVTLYNDALQMYNEGKYQDAMKNLSELLQLQPDHADAKKLQALAKRRSTPLSDAEKAKIRELYLSGMQYFSKDEYAKAITQWEKILEVDPTQHQRPALDRRSEGAPAQGSGAEVGHGTRCHHRRSRCHARAHGRRTGGPARARS